MEFVLNRKGGVPLHDQLLAQLEMNILAGGISPGQKLPSVRMLARRLGLHANTVSSAYRDLEQAGHVELRRGAGVFVRSPGPCAVEDAHGLEEMIRLALNAAARKGHSPAAIRSAVERWLRARPPERVVVVDPRAETVDLVAHEVRTRLGVPASGCTLEQLERDPALLSGALVLALPYHAGKVARLAPGAPVQTVRVGASAADRRTILDLPAGALLVVVSRSPIVLQFGAALVGGLRGDELLVETRLTSRLAEWRRIVPAADVVFADGLSLAAVRQAKPRQVHELRLLDETDLGRVRRALGTALARD